MTSINGNTLINVVHGVSTCIIQIKDVLWLHSWFACPLNHIIWVIFSIYSASFHFHEAHKDTQDQEISCELSTVPTHNYGTVFDRLSMRPNHSTGGPDIAVHSKYYQEERGQMQGRKKKQMFIGVNRVNEPSIKLCWYVVASFLIFKL